ncbi:hypothetical protein WICPIJ_009271 [Wickerhamomyces pijperi]|uniref:2,5-diamino-6-ribosylamino-4(3H)-pyrimidinone 5'-phosphate reductase n=1 Tax=Wickerhamomyces pijperi TaxID=599730 RepID=A0A9P8PPC1_WICPI|nr:hypothetical protein WICPIJ_009271 [Wickerhamomyces pijperi]
MDLWLVGTSSHGILTIWRDFDSVGGFREFEILDQFNTVLLEESFSILYHTTKTQKTWGFRSDSLIMSKLMPLPEDIPFFLAPFLPTSSSSLTPKRPFTTLTYAQSLDSRIAASPGQRTSISHLETKTMTHYLRSKHDGILIGSGTVLADDPGLNCRYTENGESHGIRPIILDPSIKWDYKGSKLEQLVQKGEGLPPWIITREVGSDELSEAALERQEYLKKHGGKFLHVISQKDGTLKWSDVLNKLSEEGIRSVMIEGGAKIINDLLANSEELVDSVIITIGPVFLGSQGVQVSPSSEVRMKDVAWWSGIQDSVVCGRLS